MQPIKTSEHATVCGMTGTGKSYLAAAYLAGFPKVVKHDTKGEAPILLAKGENPWPQVHPKELTIVYKLEDLINYADELSPYTIYSPGHEELDPYIYDAFYEWCYYQRRQTVWVDEVLEVLENPSKILKWYKGILTRGRFFDVALWQCTQRPLGLPAMCIAQSTHVFAFNMQMDQDREKVAKVTGVKEFLEKPDGHNFWYWRSGWQNAQLGVIS
ncbi:hypothetical protein [Erysipelothrix tonsillarum]|uniref:hypothetical protein n=1 Tax=Erysipelothrix tonsillarum TaxID=38402 RepID=UPI0039C84756